MKYFKEPLNKDKLLEIKKIIDSGGVVVYPTDTVYGIGGNLKKTSILKIYDVKKRESKSPLIALVSKIDKVDEVADTKNKYFKVLVEEYWPGGLTLILKSKNKVPKEMLGVGDTIGVRMPKLEHSLRIIDIAGGILPTTSANISGRKTPRSYDELDKEFLKRVEGVVEYRGDLLGEESTIVDLTLDPPKILRQGALKRESLEKTLNIKLD